MEKDYSILGIIVNALCRYECSSFFGLGVEGSYDLYISDYYPKP